MDIREAAFESSQVASMIRGGGLDVEVMPSGEFSTEEMILNIGPQHPSTHGVLRVVLELDGEVITKAEPVIGYMHRAAEKLAEYRDARQVLVLMNRHDWISAFNNELGWTIAVERLAGIEVPERAQWIRTMFAEWNRIPQPSDVQRLLPARARRDDPDLLRVPGARDDPGPDGIRDRRADAPLLLQGRRAQGRPPRGFLKRSAEVLAETRKRIGEFETLIMGNEIIYARTRDVGLLPAETAIAFGTSGPVLHASGVPMDPRKDEPYEKYAEVEFHVPVGTKGDCYDRLWVLIERMKESCNIIEQCMDRLPPGGVPGAEAPQDPQDGGRGLRPDREPARLDGLLRRGGRQEAALPAEDADGILLQRQCDPRDASGHLGPGPDRHPGLDLLRGRRRRPLTEHVGSGAGLTAQCWGRSRRYPRGDEHRASDRSAPAPRMTDRSKSGREAGAWNPSCTR